MDKNGFIVNGLPADELVGRCLQVAAIWGKTRPTKRNINIRGLEVISDFARAMNLIPRIEVKRIRKGKKK